MANFETVAQWVFEENCVKRWVMLVEVLRAFNILTPMLSNDVRDFVDKGSARGGEGNTRSCRTRAGIVKNIEEIRSYPAIAPSISVAHDSWRRRLGTEERHEGIVERAHGIRIANPHVDVTEQRKCIRFKIAQARLAQILICLHLIHRLSRLRIARKVTYVDRRGQLLSPMSTGGSFAQTVVTASTWPRALRPHTRVTPPVEEELHFALAIRVQDADELWYLVADSFNFRSSLGTDAGYATEMNLRILVTRVSLPSAMRFSQSHRTDSGSMSDAREGPSSAGELSVCAWLAPGCSRLTHRAEAARCRRKPR